MRPWVALLSVSVYQSAIAAPDRIETRPQLLRAERYDISPPITLLVASPPQSEGEKQEKGPRRVPHDVQGAFLEHDPVLQSTIAPLLVPSNTLSFQGIGAGFVGPNVGPFEVGTVPPDPQGDVGPSHYVQIVNSSFAIFGKDGHPLYGPVPTRTAFAGLSGTCALRDDGDGIVLYDALADRWLLTQLATARGTDRPYHICVAVSRSGDPTGQWARYEYAYVDFHDYPKFAVWPDAYYVTYNTFLNTNGDGFRGIAYCAMEREKMLRGEPAAQQCITIRDTVSGITPSDVDGFLPPPPGSPNVAVGFTTNALKLYQFRLDWSNPLNSFVEASAIPVAPFTEACFGIRSGACVRQGGAQAPVLDALGDRMMFRAAYRNLGEHESLVVNHSVSAGDVTGVRWYEIRDPTGTPSIFQQGTYAPADGASRWMGSAAIDRAGNIGLGFSISSTAMPPGIGYTGRVTSDAPGVMGQGEAIPVSGAGSQIPSLRWGDYSSMSVDPIDECTFWYTNEYIPADGVFNWRTQVFGFQLVGCVNSPDYSIWPAAREQALGRGRTTVIPLNTAPLRPSAAQKSLALAVRDLPPGVSPSIDPVTVAPGQTATLSLSAASDAQSGRGQGYVVSATAADGTVASVSGVLDVVDSDFSLKLDRTALMVAAGIAVTIRIDTAPLFGAPELITFSTGGLRSGLQATFEPRQVLAGDGAWLTITGANGLPPSNAAVTVVADAASTSHRAILHVRALEAPRAEISWPGDQVILSGQVQVIASAVTSGATSLSRMELLVSGRKMDGVFASTSPAVLNWDTRRVSDGIQSLVVRATDQQGGIGDSPAVTVLVQNGSDCGCAAQSGGWESLGLIGLLVAIRRRGLSCFRSCDSPRHTRGGVR
jgi:hypothetical protein